MDLQLRANNALNTVVINRWNTQLNTNTFGQPTGVSGMRTVTSQSPVQVLAMRTSKSIVAAFLVWLLAASAQQPQAAAERSL